MNTKFPELSLIGNREPWDLMFRASEHIKQQMSAIRLDQTLSRHTRYTVGHTVLGDAHTLLCDCCNRITLDSIGGAA